MVDHNDIEKQEQDIVWDEVENIDQITSDRKISRHGSWLTRFNRDENGVRGPLKIIHQQHTKIQC